MNILHKFFKEKPQRLSIIFIIIVLGLLFYWYEVRPAYIIKKCYFGEPAISINIQLPSLVRPAIASLLGGSLETSEKNVYNMEYELLKQESCWHSYGLR